MLSIAAAAVLMKYEGVPPLTERKSQPMRSRHIAMVMRWSVLTGLLLVAESQDVWSQSVSAGDRESFWSMLRRADHMVSDRERAGLRGPVRRIVEERVNEPLGLLIRGTTRITTQVVEYDEQGAEVLREEYRDWNGDLLRKIEREHDATGRPTEVLEELWGVTRAPDFFGHVGLAGDSPDFQEAVQQEFDGPTQTIQKRFRYEGDRLAEVEVRNSAVGTEVDRRLYEYDPSGRRVTVYSSNGQGDVTPASVSEFRELPHGSFERKTAYSLFGMEQAVYDADGRLRSETLYAGQAGPPRHTRRYDSAGREVERIDYDRTGRVQARILDIYDLNGTLAQSVIWSADGERVRRSYTYVFDERGNWIRRTATGSDEELGSRPGQEITERIIEYAVESAGEAPPQAADSGQP